jgi:penicillin-binding protein 2
MTVELRDSRQINAKPSRTPFFVLAGVFVLGLVTLSVNLYRLMVVRFEEFSSLSIDNEFKDVRLRAERGLIRDRRGEILVDSRPSLDVFITPAFCIRCAADVIPRLAAYLRWNEETQNRVTAEVKAAHGPQRYQPMVVAVDLSRDDFDMVLAHQYLLPGVDVEPVAHRFYRAGTSLAHVVGYMNEINPDELQRLNQQGDEQRPTYALGDYTGRRGIERSFEHLLRGKDGWVKRVVNARGELMRDAAGNPLERDRVVQQPGHNVVLSIDARLQAEAERSFLGTSGAVVVMETKTGFIRAMVSRPAFDPNEMTGRVTAEKLTQMRADPLQPMIFRAGAQHYHPGSTFKVVTLLAGLQSGQFDANSSVSCSGRYRLGGRAWRCHKDSGHGTVHPLQAIQISCDTMFYKIADTLGIDAIAQVGRDFGLGAVTNLTGVGEVPGVMPDTEFHNKHTPGGYTKGLALNTAIGQGDVNVTPLQVAVLYAAIANGGAVFQPQVVKSIERPDGTVLEEMKPKLVRTVPMQEEHRKLLLAGLSAVVNVPGGTAYRSRLDEVKVAGKTGTAQVAALGLKRLKKEEMDFFARDHAWFASFAPADDSELTIVVLNEHGGHGGTDAAPTAAALYRKYFELKRLDAQSLGQPWSASTASPAKAENEKIKIDESPHNEVEGGEIDPKSESPLPPQPSPAVPEP